MQSGGVAQLAEFLAIDVQVATDRLNQLGDAVEMVAEVGVVLDQSAQQDVGALTSCGGAPGALLRVHGDVGRAHRFGRAGGVVGDHDAPERRRDREAVAGLAQRAARRVLQRASLRRVGER